MSEHSEQTTAVPERVPSAAALRALVDLAPDGVFIADLDGRYTFVNEAGCALLGRAPDEMLGCTIMDLIPPEDVPRLQASKENLLRGRAHIGEWRLKRADGSYAEVEVNARILADGQWVGFVRDISERKQHAVEREALLAQTECDRQRLQTILDTLPLGVLLYRAGGDIAFNAAAERLIGMKLSPFGGASQYGASFHRTDGTPVAADDLLCLRAYTQGLTCVGEEYCIHHADEKRVPVLVSAAPIRDAAGVIAGSVCVLQDITERKLAEERLAGEQRLLQAVFDVLPVGVWITDGAGRIARNNPAGERIWKGARYVGPEDFGEYKGWWLDTGKPISAEDWALARALNKGQASTGELVRIQCFDGSFKTIINFAAPLRGPGGEIAGAIVVNEDITPLQEAQEKLRSSELLLRTMIELVPVGLWVADREGKIVLANPAGKHIWSGARYVGPEQFGEYKGWWVDSGKPIAPDEWGLARAVRKGETSRNELIRIQCFDGSYKTVMNFAAPIRSEAGEIVGAVALNEDITALQYTQEQLRRAVRDREEILAIVTHDLRNPLSGLTMSATALGRQAAAMADGESVRALATQLADIARRMSGMVDDLLAVAVASTGGRSMLKLAPVAASSLIARASDAARPLLARQGLTLEFDLEEGLPHIEADADRILRVFGNLLDNALKFTTAPGRIRLGAHRASGGVRFSIANSGPALPARTLKSMFRPFWQAGRDHRGTGLGLAICSSIVEAHGGTIWAEPAAGEQVRVCFVLPRKPSEQPSDAQVD